MGRSCAVPGCVSGRKASESKVTIFKTPKDVELRRKWSSALGQELKATSFICELHFNPEDVIKTDQKILKNGYLFVYEYQRVHLKKNAEPKSNINNDSDDSMLTDEELPNPFHIIDCNIPSPGSGETSIDNEIIDEVIEPENNNCANTNFTDDANTVTENDNFLIINTEEFSFHSFKVILESQPLRKNWSWTVIKDSFISLSYISMKLELVCHVKIDVDLKVTVINAKTNIIIDMNVNISSIACVWQLLKTLDNSFFCSGTGYNDTKCSDTCTGILLPEERYKRRVVEYRCITCRKLRCLIQKRKTETKDYKDLWMNLKHRYILQRRKLNRAVHKIQELKVGNVGNHNRLKKIPIGWRSDENPNKNVKNEIFEEQLVEVKLEPIEVLSDPIIEDNNMDDSEEFNGSIHSSDPKDDIPLTIKRIDTESSIRRKMKEKS